MVIEMTVASRATLGGVSRAGYVTTKPPPWSVGPAAALEPSVSAFELS